MMVPENELRDAKTQPDKCSSVKDRLRRVYVCHPFGADPDGNVLAVLKISRSLVKGGDLPISPQMFIPAFVDERTERELALSLCLELVAVCDELWVYGPVTAGMRREIRRAETLSIPVRYVTKELGQCAL